MALSHWIRSLVFDVAHHRDDAGTRRDKKGIHKECKVSGRASSGLKSCRQEVKVRVYPAPINKFKTFSYICNLVSIILYILHQ